MRYGICNRRRNKGLRLRCFETGPLRSAGDPSRGRSGKEAPLPLARPVPPLAPAVSPPAFQRAGMAPRGLPTTFPETEHGVLGATVALPPVAGPADECPLPAPGAGEHPMTFRRTAPPPENRRGGVRWGSIDDTNGGVVLLFSARATARRPSMTVEGLYSFRRHPQTTAFRLLRRQWNRAPRRHSSPAADLLQPGESTTVSFVPLPPAAPHLTFARPPSGTIRKKTLLASRGQEQQPNKTHTGNRPVVLF
jgi:hypothetical protein